VSHDQPKMPSTDDSITTLSLLTDALDNVAPDPVVRARLLTELRGRERWTPWGVTVAALLEIPVAQAVDALQQIEDAAVWQPGLWPGSKVFQTPALAQACAILARIPPGTRIARHRHEQRELTYLLDGELADEHRVFGRGDLVDMAIGTEHALAVGGTGDCLVVFFLRAR